MEFKNGTKLRQYICMQQLLIGIVQGLLTVALLRMEGTLNKWCCGSIAVLNFCASILLVGHYGVQLYPPEFNKKQCRATFVIALSFGANFAALCLIIILNHEQDLTAILTFNGGDTASNALALYFYITLYITLLLSISSATYCLINACEALPTARHADDDPEQCVKDEDEVPGILMPTIHRHNNILRDEFKIVPEVHARSPRHQRRSSRCSPVRKVNAKQQIPSTDSDEDDFERPRGRPYGSRGVPMNRRPPTPPPLPPPEMWIHENRQRPGRFQNLNDQIAQASRSILRDLK